MAHDESIARGRGGYLPLPGPVFVPERCPDAGVRFRAPAGTPVHAVTGGEVVAVRRHGDARAVEIDSHEGHRYSYKPLARTFVTHGGVVPSGHVLGILGGDDRESGLELHITDASGAPIDPQPLLVGLADPNELGYDSATSVPIDPGDGERDAT